MKGEKLVEATDSPNIIFIVIDAVRTKNLSCYGYSKPTSPNIDNLAKEGILFEDAFSCSNATDASLTTIFSGMYPMSHGVLSHGGHWLGKLMGEVDTKKIDKVGIRFLPEILKSKDYTTLAIDWLGRWHSRGYDYYSGMMRHAKPISFPVTRVDSALRVLSRRYVAFQKPTIIDDAHLVTSQARNLITKYRNKKFFLFIHYWDTHAPYAPPTNFYKNIGEGGANKILRGIANPSSWKKRNWKAQEYIARYDACIRYVDHEVGKLVEHLETLGILDRTLIVLTSDHGESLTEHGIFFRHHGLYDVSLHVPIIIRYPGFPKNKRIKGFVQHFDIVPTLFELLKIKNSDFDGISVMPLIHEEVDQLHSAVYAEEALYERKRTIRTATHKYIHALTRKGAVCRHCKRIHGGIEELYDLKEDPNETKNIVKEKSDVTATLKKDLAEWIGALRF